MAQTLSLRDLNRTLLHRQLLLERATMPVLSAVERLVALQSQIPNPPYIGLWSRLHDFQRDALHHLMERRQVLRVPSLRSTLHLMSATDAHATRSLIFPALLKGMNGFHGRSLAGIDADSLIEKAMPYLKAAPRTMGDIKDFLQPFESDRMGEALNYLIRTYVPLTQVPPAGTWGSGTMAKYALLDSWLGEPSGEPLPMVDFFRRYLAGYGPAGVMDFQTWAGLTNVQKELAPFRDQFTIYQTEGKREVWDNPDAKIIAGDTPAPIRFVPEYDNLVIAHQDRTRIVSDADKSKVFLTAGRVAGTILLDGFVGAVWKPEKPSKKSLVMAIDPFAPPSDSDRAAMIEEAERLGRWIADDEGIQISVEIRA